MSELRRDLVSGDWIIMAPERAKRPKFPGVKKSKRIASPIKECPFEDLTWSGNWPPILSFPNDAKWEVVLIRNKYPALFHIKGCAQSFKNGPHLIRSGVGEHDLVITKDHYKNFADISLAHATEVFKILQRRYKMLAKDECSVYTSTFFNWGPSAGASLYHPHYQVLTLPIIPPDIEHSLNGSRRYFAAHRKCVHCVMLDFDMKEKKRIIETNSSAIAVVPFVSRVPFEVRIFPKKHFPRFEATPEKTLKGVAALLQSILKRIRKNIGDPDLNFFIHTAPLKGGSFGYYHWHIEIIPKISNWGGFELGTGIDINVVDPEMAMAILRGKTPKK
ncbi:MAG: hypothetical protein A3B25_01745 [Candidatus Ryanbacteria bacterium RIFCSPLOWO2_01_FULL_48_26]|uniref:DUF4921 domain-containing protein n=1 Tax=Candidatus Ryanbacteria bacterium RIFCSPLOWO2_01_FULL_48_26 TaxID=1802126 RepID=A0A1G2GX54_9BACT|nr:MAG: hypothetical protein A3B25_01745 [Candidatus Ryanbacteria bacterium RIFCSPLOWO2_01_FULL_48_26]